MSVPTPPPPVEPGGRDWDPTTAECAHDDEQWWNDREYDDEPDE